MTPTQKLPMLSYMTYQIGYSWSCL